MNTDFDKYDKIDRYLNGEMLQEELGAFEQQLATDLSLRQDVELQQEANNLIVDNAMLSFQSKIKDYSQQNKGSKFPWKYGIAGVALIGILVWYLSPSSTPHQGFSTNHSDEKSASIPEAHSAPLLKPTFLTSSNEEVAANPTKGTGKKSIEKVNDFRKDDSRTTPPETQGNTTINPDIQKSNHEMVASNVLKKGDTTLENSRDEIGAKLSGKAVTKSLSQENLCRDMFVDISTTPEASCFGEQEGSLTIRAKLKQGNERLKFSLNNQRPRSIPTFENLKSGAYRLTIEATKSGCDTTVSVNVPAKMCASPTTDAVALNTRLGDVWDIPVEAYTNFTLHIYNRQGKEVYVQAYRSMEYYEWTGVGNSGSSLPSATYIYDIRNEKGETILLGEIGIQ